MPEKLNSSPENLCNVEEGPPLRRPSFKVRVAAALSLQALYLIGRTWKVKWVNESIVDEWSNKGCIFAFWHGTALIPAWAYRNKGVAVMVSLHRDGEIMNRALAGLGFCRVRGSTTRGGRQALSTMINLLRRSKPVAITPDGPKGPSHTIHPGVLLLAARTGKPIIPAGLAAKSAWRLNSWDRFTIPKPFTTLQVVLGDPFFVTQGLDRSAMEMKRDTLISHFAELEQRAQNFDN